jgi:hypothetical protein
MAMLCIGLLFNNPGLAGGSLGPTTSGVVNILVAFALRRRLAASGQAKLNVTVEAKAMLSSLAWQFLWRPSAWAWSPEFWSASSAAPYAKRPGGAGLVLLGMDQTLRHVPDSVLELIEQAAFQHNRIAGILETRRSEVLDRVGAKVATASDEGILDVMHQAFLTAQYPEGSGPIQTKLASDVAQLTELGDRVETLALSQPTFTERLSRRSGMDEVLDELRLEQSARLELGHSTADEAPIDQTL